MCHCPTFYDSRLLCYWLEGFELLWKIFLFVFWVLQKIILQNMNCEPMWTKAWKSGYQNLILHFPHKFRLHYVFDFSYFKPCDTHCCHLVLIKWVTEHWSWAKLLLDAMFAMFDGRHLSPLGILLLCCSLPGVK